MTDLPFAYEEPVERPALARPKPHRHRWTVKEPIICWTCSQPFDAVASRRGKNNRSRGNSIEREIAKKLGLRRTGQYGGKDDLSGDLFKAQVKSGGAFSERYWNWLKSVPTDASQTPLLVVTDAPGPGYRRRAVVVLDLEDWALLHGDAAAAE